jgi:hypothetical protein
LLFVRLVLISPSGIDRGRFRRTLVESGRPLRRDLNESPLEVQNERRKN